MKTKQRVLTTLISFLILTFGLYLAHSQTAGASAQAVVGSASAPPLDLIGERLGTGFTYQGRLTDGGSPANGEYDLRFRVYDAASGGIDLALDEYKDDVSITEGLFTVQLDFGNTIFTGDARWLEIAVRPGASTGAYTTLTPRQRLTPAPYALALPGLWTQQNATSPNLIGGYGGNSVAAGVVGATIGGGGNQDYPNQISADYATIGGGWSNLASGSASTVGGGQFNQAAGYDAAVGGGLSNDAAGDYATVGGGVGNQAAGNYAIVSGGVGNDAAGGSATVGGGDSNQAAGDRATVGGGNQNDAAGDYATVGGGVYNQATWDGATVGGGYDNRASGWGATIGGGEHNKAYDNEATVGGGWSNQASGLASTVGGGDSNQAAGLVATVGGGDHNDASGDYATVPGGRSNVAQGSYSFAVGRRAKAMHDGTIILADSNDFDFASIVPNTFRVRATGGIRFVLGIDGSSGDPTWSCLVNYGSSWSCSSDRNLKENLILADGSDVLERLSQMPVYYWNAKGQATPHIGPMAQDFYAAYGVGDSDTSIATIDLDGVALAAIQGLYAQNKELEQQNADLEARVAALEATLANGSEPTRVSQSNLLLWAGIISPWAGILLLWAFHRRDMPRSFNGGR